MRTQVVDRNILLSDLLDILENLESLVRSHEAGKRTAFLMDSSSRTSSSTLLSLLAYQPKNRVENIFKQIMHENIIKSEQISAISAPIMIKYLLNYVRKRIRLSSSGMSYDEIDKIIEDDIKAHQDKIQKLMKRATFKDLKYFLEENFREKIAEATLAALECAGPSGTITFEHSNVSNIIVEAKKFYEFDIIPDENILIQKNYEWRQAGVRTLCVEGFIETVSEIDRILSCVTEKKVPLLIVCLGYSPEVVSTVLLNNDRGTFNVMLACPIQEQYSVNDLGDMAQVFGAPYHGYQTGAISSSFKEEDFDVSCEEIIVTADRLKVRRKASRQAVEKRQKSLKKQIGESDFQDDYLQRRISSLSSNQVKISIPEKTSQQKFSEIEELDEALRCAKSIMRFGIIKISDDNQFFEPGTYIPSSIYTGMVLGYKFSSQLFNIDKCVIIDS